MPRSGSDCIGFQLVTGMMPFPESTDPIVAVLILRGRRPQKPRRFETPGMTPAVWKIAEKCWHQRAKERPEVNTVLQRLENLANSGTCAHEARSCLEREIINLRLWQVTPIREYHFFNDCEKFLTAENNLIGESNVSLQIQALNTQYIRYDCLMYVESVTFAPLDERPNAK